MAKKSKMEDVMDDMIGSKSTKLKRDNPKPEGKPPGESAYIRVNFNISKAQRDKLKQYAAEIAPAHLRISQSQLIRYMIENFDSTRARENFFKSNY